MISIGEMEDDEERDIFYFIYFNTWILNDEYMGFFI